ncbi:SDR family NAD(P)-dependent oxidoreductase [Shewanella sp. VB17]|uniref:SDR family NAD(P)-dependent oxidoreductase n=1 Tax=Shewanella sp. VB17 TaxID=2739432 RepID=UPI001563DFE8|nr:SDR family NAD(P)-dependent oxidoreductase [Shewanella sp. VB17]NRD74817.1 SDR family NAD(P)-dependent oxidoreductase [Shewanella sp. VB17]
MQATAKLVLITGASSGVGASMAKCFAQNGYYVGIGYNNNKEKAERIVNDITTKNEQALAVNFDYSNRESIQKAIATLTKYFNKPVSILINNGAIAQEKPFHTITDEDWQRMLLINLQGPFMATQEVLPQMQTKNWGRIINISSIGGQWGGFNQVHYAASKAALINFTQSMAKIYSKNGIASMTIAIGLVETPMSASELNTDLGKEKLKNIPAQRLATVEEIAELAVQLCKEQSSYLSGQTLNMNGGMYFG